MSRLQAFLRKSEKSLLMALAVGAILLAAFVVIVEPLTGWLPGIHAFVPGITLVLLSTFVLYFFARERMLQDYTRWQGLGIRAIYRSRNDKDQYDEYMQLLQGAEKELFIVGITLKDLSRDHAPLLREKARKGCSIRLLLLSPRYWANSEPVLDPVAAAMSADLAPNFLLAVANLRALAMGMAEVSGKMEVRFYHQAPTLSLTMVDGDTRSARMRVELTPHNTPDCDYFRPMLDLHHSGGSDLCGQFYQRYRALWDASERYLAVSNSRVWVDSALDAEIMEELGLPDDWLPASLQAADAPN